MDAQMDESGCIAHGETLAAPRQTEKHQDARHITVCPSPSFPLSLNIPGGVRGPTPSRTGQSPAKPPIATSNTSNPRHYVASL